MFWPFQSATGLKKCSCQFVDFFYFLLQGPFYMERKFVLQIPVEIYINIKYEAYKSQKNVSR